MFRNGEVIGKGGAIRKGGTIGNRALNLNFCFRVRVVAILSEIWVKMSEI